MPILGLEIKGKNFLAECVRNDVGLRSLSEDKASVSLWGHSKKSVQEVDNKSKYLSSRRPGKRVSETGIRWSGREPFGYP